MEEGQEGPPKGKSFLQKGWNFLKESLGVGIPEIPTEKINQESVAKTIINYLGNPLRQRVEGDRWANPFSITTVMKNMGHVAPLAGTDYQKRFPEEYRTTREALWGLVQEGVLVIRRAEEKDKEGEQTLYRVVNEEKLREIAEQKT